MIVIQSMMIERYKNEFSVIESIQQFQMSQTEPVKQVISEETVPPVVTPASTFDEIPIGKGPKFNFTEFPEEGAVAKAPPKRKKAAKVQTKVKEQGENQAQKPIQSTSVAQMKKGNPLDEIPIGGNTFDQKPIGKSNFMMDEFPPEGEEVHTEYPMLQKIKSKANKLRLEGMQDLLVLLQNESDHPDYSEINMATLLKETTPLNMEKALQCMKAWMDRGRDWGEDQIRNIIQFGYINGKGAGRKLAVDLIDAMYGEKAAVLEINILLGLKHKIPKMIAGFIGVINQLLAVYGIKRMKYLKPYFGQVVRVLNAEKLLAVKNQGIELIKSAFKWLTKEVVMPMIDTLKEGLRKELETFWQSYDKNTVMSAPKDIPQEKGKVTKKVDAYELSEAVDVFKKFNERWAESVLSAEKWNEKTKLMEQFVKGANTPKLANTEYRHITELIKRLINDSNFNVVLWSMKMLGVMARGLRRQFLQTIRSMFGTVISKFRDKKSQMIDETFNTLQDFLHAISLEDILEDLKEGLQDKAPNMKVNLINWVAKAIDYKENKGQINSKTKDAVKDLFNIFQKLLADSTADVRDGMAKGISKMKLILGEDFFMAIQKNLNKTQVSKMQVDPKDVKKKPTETSKVSQKKLEKPQKQETKKIDSKAMTFDSPTFQESLSLLVAEGFPQEEIKNITDGGAKERQKILTLMKQNAYSSLNCVLRVLKRSMKDWRQANLNMNKQFCQFLQDNAGQINKEQAYVVLPFIVERFGDNKFVESLTTTITAMCTRVSPSFLSTTIIAYTRSTQAKRPKIYGDSCMLLTRILELVSASFMRLPIIMQFAQESFNIIVAKKGASQLIKTTYSYVQEAVKSMLSEGVYKVLEGELKSVRVLQEDEKKAKVVFEGEAAMECKQNKVSAKGGNKGAKVDVSGDVVRLLPRMNDKDNWQVRKEAAEAMIKILNDNECRVSFGPIHDLIATLKVRMCDPNKGLIKTFLSLTGLVFSAMGEKDLKAHAKTFVTSLADGLSDKLEANRKETHITLHKFGEAMGGEVLLSQLGAHLEGEKESRLEILVFILSHEEWLVKADLRDYPKGLVGCLCDKNRELRMQGERLFECIHERIGVETFRNVAKDTKPAFLKDLNVFFDKFEKSNGSKNMIDSRVSMRRTSPSTKDRRSSAQHPTPSRQKQSIPKHSQRQIQTEQKRDKSLVINSQFLAPLKVLVLQRADRQQMQQTYLWKTDQIKQVQEQDLSTHIRLLFRADLSRRMLSFDTRRAKDAVVKISQLCSDVNYQGHIKELYDIILKWALLRLWGGNHHMLNMIEVVKDVLSVLEKKNVMFADFELDLVLSIVREYILSAYLVSTQLSGSVFVIFKCLVALSSGQKVIKKMFKMYSTDFISVPPQAKTQYLGFLRSGLNGIIKERLMNYVGSEEMLEEASKLPQLRSDKGFVELLSRKFHEKVLASFGFRAGEPIKSQNYPMNKNEESTFKSNSIQRNEPLRLNDTSRSVEMTKVDGSKSPMSQGVKKTPPLLSPNIPRHDLSRTIIEQMSSTNEQSMARTMGSGFNQGSRQAELGSMQMLVSQVSQMDRTSERVLSEKGIFIKERLPFDIQTYPAPLPSSSLAKHLRYLFPPTDDSVIVFFTEIFSGSGEKITTELNNHAKLIFGSILRSVQEMLKNRRSFPPEKIIGQINLLQNCIKCKAVTNHANQLLYYCANFALAQLVYEDENKNSIEEDLRVRKIDFKIDQFVRAINGVMLRILQNTDATDVTLILYQLLMNHLTSPYPASKTTNLIAKCMARVSPKFPINAQPRQIQQFILRSNQYLNVARIQKALQQFKIQNAEKPKPQQTIMNMIKSVLADLGKECGSEIWEHYKKAMNMSRFKDQHIASYLTYLNIRYPEQVQEYRGTDDIKNIIQLLSKNKSFEAGMSKLRSYNSLHPDFDVAEYFASHNYDERFIEMVQRELAGNKRTPRKDRDDKSQGSKRGSLQGAELQKKMEKLKQKFQELQPENNQSKIHKDQKPMAAEERTQLIQRRINQMKNNMTSAVHSRARND